MISKEQRPEHLVVAWHDWFDWMASADNRDQFCNISGWFLVQQIQRGRDVVTTNGPEAFEDLLREATSHILAAYEEFLKPEYRRCLKKEIR